MSLKVIFTHSGALSSKYGAAGAKRIATAVKNLITADAARSLDTRLVSLDDSASMSPFGATPVANPSDRAAVKAAIDAVYAALRPDYLMILGSTDVVPHQELTNPMYGDDDRAVPSDLPYACDAPYAARASDFRGPTRVVGRLPDVTGGTDPAYLENLLATAAGWQSQPPGRVPVLLRS